MSTTSFFRGFLALGLILAAAGWAAANTAGPPAGNSGSPPIGTVSADQTCARSGCHVGNPTNNALGTIEILGLPENYVPGQTYDLTVRLASTSTQGSAARRWGFQLTCLRAETGRGTGAGTFAVPAELRTQNLASNQRTYVTHTQSSLRTGQLSPATWTLQWTAPPDPQGTILFYFAGNAANGNGSSAGDFIYLAVDSTRVDSSPVEPASWGGIKSRGIR